MQATSVMKNPRQPRIPFSPQRWLDRGRQFQSVATGLDDMDAAEPNWPKYFLVTHSIELAITAFLMFAKEPNRPQPPGKKPQKHDLLGLYERAVRMGLKRDALVTADLPHLSELHKVYYARYPAVESRPVAFISQFDDMVDQLFGDIDDAIRPS
jgi:hypothetical protein